MNLCICFDSSFDLSFGGYGLPGICIGGSFLLFLSFLTSSSPKRVFYPTVLSLYEQRRKVFPC